MALRIGFVGVGGIASRHLEYCQGRDDVEIVGHADVRLDLAQKAAATYGGHAYDSYEQLFASESPQAIIIATPPFAHGDLEEAACDRGIHFFVEKPVAVNLDLARRVLTAVERSGVITQVGYMYRFTEPIRRVRDLLSKHGVAMVQAHFYMPGLPPPAWYPLMALGGGQLVEQATHMLDLGRFLAGDVVAVQGRSSRTRDWTPPPDFDPGDGMRFYAPEFDIPDATALILEYASGALGTLSCSIVPQARWDNGFKVVADGLIATIDGPNASWAEEGGEEGNMEAAPDWANQVLAEFLEVVKTGNGACSVPYVEGAKSLALSIAGYESMARGGGPVNPLELLSGKSCGKCCAAGAPIPTQGANLPGSDLSGRDLSRADMTGSNLHGADLSGSDLSGANLSASDLAEADLSGSDLSNVQMMGCNLAGADLSGSDLSHADLAGCHLLGADLSGSDLSQATATGCNFTGADLSGSDLSQANLSGSNLTSADLSGCDLSHADLSGCNLTGTDCSGADLSGAILIGAVGFSPA